MSGIVAAAIAAENASTPVPHNRQPVPSLAHLQYLCVLIAIQTPAMVTNTVFGRNPQPPPPPPPHLWQPVQLLAAELTTTPLLQVVATLPSWKPLQQHHRCRTYPSAPVEQQLQQRLLAGVSHFSPAACFELAATRRQRPRGVAGENAFCKRRQEGTAIERSAILWQDVTPPQLLLVWPEEAVVSENEASHRAGGSKSLELCVYASLECHFSRYATAALSLVSGAESR